MSSEKNIHKRVLDLLGGILKMVTDGIRDPHKVADILQTIVDMKVYLKRLFAEEVINFGDVTIIIYELVKDATFLEMFGDLGKKRRCWKNKEEVLVFTKQNKDKLGPNGNFFELEGGFVADVGLDGGGQPCVDFVSPLSGDYAWDAEFQHRVFSPQQ